MIHTSHNGRKHGLPHGIPLNLLLGSLVKSLPLRLVLLGNALLERAIKLRFLEKIGEGLENGADLCAGLPGVGLEEAEADVAERVVCHVGVVDARGELDNGGLEGVVGGQGEDDTEAAWVVGRRGRGLEGDVPGVDGLVGGEGDGEALGGFLGDFSEFLCDALGGRHCDGW